MKYFRYRFWLTLADACSRVCGAIDRTALWVDEAAMKCEQRAWDTFDREEEE